MSRSASQSPKPATQIPHPGSYFARYVSLLESKMPTLRGVGCTNPGCSDTACEQPCSDLGLTWDSYGWQKGEKEDLRVVDQ